MEKEKEAKRLFKQFPFYNALIEKPYIKHLNNIVMLRELPFYNELSIVKTSKAFKGYERSYSIEIIDSKNPSFQLTINKLSIKDLSKDLWNEIKGFKYQITLKVLLNKYKENAGREFPPVYINSTTKTVIGPKYNFNKSFQEVFYRIDNCISEGSGCIIESIDAQYVNISIYSPLSGSSYIELSDKLRNSKKGSFNIKNNDNKCFLWCYIKHLN